MEFVSSERFVTEVDPGEDPGSRRIGVLLTRDDGRVLMVRSRTWNWGFPKGKRRADEEFLDTAFRELEEETGIPREEVEPLTDRFLRTRVRVPEMVTVDREDGSPRTTLLIGRYVGDPDRELRWDPTELIDVAWLSVDQLRALDETVFNPRRKRALEDAVEKLSRVSSTAGLPTEEQVPEEPEAVGETVGQTGGGESSGEQ